MEVELLVFSAEGQLTTGFGLGWIAGAPGALGYSFACPVISLAFVAICYTAGILLSGRLDCALGSRLLSW